MAMGVLNQFLVRTTWPADAPLEKMLAKLREFAEAQEARILEVGPDHLALRLRYGMNPQIAYRLFVQLNGGMYEAVLQNADSPVHSTDIFAVWMTARHFMDALAKAFEAQR